MTIEDIKAKQLILDKEIRELLHKFYDETKVVARGEINFGYTDEKHQHYVSLNYDNPFK